MVPDPVNGSDINWTLGTPNNLLAASAHSGTNAWGSDLNDSQNFTLASSFLYSPVIDLSGLQSATLTFWDVYDFSRLDPIVGMYYEEDGGVFISTNNSTPPSLNLPLGKEFVDRVADTWQQETVDLTPWVGRTIQLVFYYQGFNFGDTMYGWTFDDVSITGVAAAANAGGNINISKNLGQGTWSLASLSPIGLVPVQTSVAPAVTISNLAAGQYVVQFSDVPYYQTPTDQTNTLATGATATFTGNYTFLDVNQNGISDAWEMDNFGTVVTNRTQLTDTDHDGMSDYAEFIAGTNPTNAASRFYFNGETIQSNRLIQMQWTVVTNRLYQVNLSTNLKSWTPVTAWLQASNNPAMNYSATNASRSQFYRVQVRP